MFCLVKTALCSKRKNQHHQHKYKGILTMDKMRFTIVSGGMQCNNSNDNIICAYL